MKKIFCIGFNKTGTSSLHAFFKAVGYSSVHNNYWPRYSNSITGAPYYLHSRCYTDGEQANFCNLEKWFPSSVFILNIRDELPWLKSRIKHVLRRNEEQSAPKSFLRSKHYGPMAKEFFTDEETAIKKWILERRLYHKQARGYFQGNSRFMEMDVTTNPSWKEELTDFLSTNGFRLKQSKGDLQIHANKRDDQKISDRGQLEAYYKLAAQLLENS